jgi:hypothetical protein
VQGGWTGGRGQGDGGGARAGYDGRRHAAIREMLAVLYDALPDYSDEALPLTGTMTAARPSR